MQELTFGSIVIVSGIVYVGVGNKMSMFNFEAINFEGILRIEDLFVDLFGFSVQKVFMMFNGFSTILVLYLVKFFCKL